MKRVIAATLGLAVLTAYSAALAQESREDDPIIVEQKEKAKEREALDKRYKATLEQTRKDGPVERVDPWANMRGTPSAAGKR